MKKNTNHPLGVQTTAGEGFRHLQLKTEGKTPKNLTAQL